MNVFKSIAAKAILQPLTTKRPTTKSLGDSGEARALEYLAQRGLMLVARNFKTPGRGGGEVDLIMRSPDGTLVFVEVRQRKSASHGGAAASISATKRKRIIFAAQHYISRLSRLPPCRFDVVTLQGDGQETEIEWLQAAFDAS
jgi:putative endonuclease